VFTRAFLWTVLAWAAVNAASCPLRTGGFGNLFGDRPERPCRLGFPLAVWREREVPDSLLPIIRAMSIDVFVGLACSTLVAAIVSRRAEETPREAEPVPFETASAARFQVSLRELLLLTAAVGIVLGVMRNEEDAYRGALMIVSLAGPYALLWLGHFSRRWFPKSSMRVSVAAALVLVIASAVLGQLVEGLHDFTRGLMALFVCWTPQLLLIIGILELWRRTHEPSRA